MVRGGLCVIGGGGLGLCSHGMGIARLRRPGVRQPRQVDRFFEFFHMAIEAIGAHKCCKGTTIMGSEGVYARDTTYSRLI